MSKSRLFVFQAVNLVVGILLCFSIQAKDNVISVAASPSLPSLEQPAGKVILTVDGLITQTNYNDQAHLDLAMIQALTHLSINTSTVVTDGIKRFDGVLVRDLFESLGISDQAQYIEATALNDYLVEIPLADFYENEVLLATHMDGVQLKPTDKGPLWIVYPRDRHRKLQDIRYDYRWVWQLKHLHIR
ncbi:MAG TPA: molybdopterin-dependent oxidoreductase [Gammaproteobacteria bacterium]|nr:molybdopterin-dependent oxidoreductase [Gammaproteobacteria bacterium]